jgi:hypothetical protein
LQDTRLDAVQSKPINPADLLAAITAMAHRSDTPQRQDLRLLAF